MREFARVGDGAPERVAGEELSDLRAVGKTHGDLAQGAEGGDRYDGGDSRIACGELYPAGGTVRAAVDANLRGEGSFRRERVHHLAKIATFSHAKREVIARGAAVPAEV